MTIKAKQGLPLPYVLRAVKGEDGKFSQQVIVECCDCDTTESRSWTRRENPKLICEIFERAGWVIYQNKARCPLCGEKRRKQQAFFASRKDHQKEQEMDTAKPVHVLPTNRPRPEKTEPPQQIYLLTIDAEGTPTLTPLTNAQEMLFGDQAYLVIPQISRV
jgi:hypothetical protein